ncbi:MAG: hypothetical protein V3V97_11145 [Hyphomicrobiaceae bacterium]
MPNQPMPKLPMTAPGSYMSVGAVAGVAAFEVGRVFEAECVFAVGAEAFA